MSWVRSDWHSTLEDLIFKAEMLGSPVEFSGNLRPIVSPKTNNEGTP